MRRFKVPVLVVGLAAILGLPGLAAAEDSPLLSDALEQARAEGKPVLVDFYTDW